MVLEVVYKLCPVRGLRAVVERRVELRLRQGILVSFDVLLVVPAQAIPRSAVQEEGHALEDDGQAHVEVSVFHVVVQQAGALFAAVRAPEKASRVDPSTEDQRRGYESCKKQTVAEQINLGAFVSLKNPEYILNKKYKLLLLLPFYMS